MFHSFAVEKPEMTRFHVNGKVVNAVDLLRKRHWLCRFDLWPFFVLYTTWMIIILPSLDFLDSFIILGGLLTLHIFMFLFSIWSVDFKCFLQYSKVSANILKETINIIDYIHVFFMRIVISVIVRQVKDIDIHLANACKITPAKFCGTKEVVPLCFRKVVIIKLNFVFLDVFFT